MLNERDSKLAAADAATKALQARIQELETQILAVSGERDKLVVSEKDLREKIEVASRLSESVQTEVKLRNERLTQLETANLDLRKRADERSSSLTRSAKLMQDLEEINRRRENQLTSLHRRYREVTDWFRTLAVQLSNPREAASPGNNELSRIQTAVAVAEEELRQLQALSAQSRRVQKEILAGQKD